jgi:hypothetical protein
MTEIDDSKTGGSRSDMRASRKAPGAPVLVTAHQVLFASAAARGLVPEKGLRRWMCAAGALRRKFAISRSEARPRRYRPERYEFLDASCMAREMRRL